MVSVLRSAIGGSLCSMARYVPFLLTFAASFTALGCAQISTFQIRQGMARTTLYGTSYRIIAKAIGTMTPLDQF